MAWLNRTKGARRARAHTRIENPSNQIINFYYTLTLSVHNNHCVYIRRVTLRLSITCLMEKGNLFSRKPITVFSHAHLWLLFFSTGYLFICCCRVFYAISFTLSLSLSIDGSSVKCCKCIATTFLTASKYFKHFIFFSVDGHWNRNSYLLLIH